jgi:polynucleotide 5'-triphosphatase
MSILNVEPMDEFVRDVADFIHGCIVNANLRPGTLVEVEAKIGTLVQRGTRDRIFIPARTETSE